jgi:hypothetical protein
MDCLHLTGSAVPCEDGAPSPNMENKRLRNGVGLAATANMFLNKVFNLTLVLRLVCLRSDNEVPLVVQSVAIDGSGIFGMGAALAGIGQPCTHGRPMLLSALKLDNR